MGRKRRGSEPCPEAGDSGYASPPGSLNSKVNGGGSINLAALGFGMNALDVSNEDSGVVRRSTSDVRGNDGHTIPAPAPPSFPAPPPRTDVSHLGSDMDGRIRAGLGGCGRLQGGFGVGPSVFFKKRSSVWNCRTLFPAAFPRGPLTGVGADRPNGAIGPLSSGRILRPEGGLAWLAWLH